MYKNMLDNQIQMNNNLRPYGNMTFVEKRMNKQDLKAWKKFDNNQYCLIPGISKNRKFMENMKKSKELSFNDQQKRLQQYGMLNNQSPYKSNVSALNKSVDYTGSRLEYDAAGAGVNA